VGRRIDKERGEKTCCDYSLRMLNVGTRECLCHNTAKTQRDICGGREKTVDTYLRSKKGKIRPA
jgi:hypothetical protein